MENVFSTTGLSTFQGRINQLSPISERQWGTMTPAQMLAHLNVAYDMALTEKYTKPTGLKKWMLKKFVKQAVVGPKPFKKNGRTAPQFLVSDERDFEKEKATLLTNIQKVYDLGAEYFDNRESHSFGRLTSEEWNVMFAKHLDHHLRQFGV